MNKPERYKLADLLKLKPGCLLFGLVNDKNGIGIGSFMTTKGAQLSGAFVDAKLWNGTKLYISGDKFTYLNGKKYGSGSYASASNGEKFEQNFIVDVLWN